MSCAVPHQYDARLENILEGRNNTSTANIATSMFANFTSADRRKKVVTYGKSSRLSTIATPSPAPSEDAPSPERPRKHISSSGGALKKLGSKDKSGRASGDADIHTGGPDVFDVPSEDEFQFRATKLVKKFPTKHRIPDEGREVPTQNRKTDKAIQPLRRPEPTRLAASTTRKPQKLAQVPEPAQVRPPSIEDPITLQIQRAKQTRKDAEVVQQPRIASKRPSRATTPAQSTAKTQKNVKTNALSISRNTSTKPSVKHPQDPDIFDVPSSDEEARLPTRKPSRPGRAGRAGVPAQPTKVTTDIRVKDAAESDDSNTSKKRKRQGSISSVSTVKPAAEQKREPSVPPRSRKYQKRDDSVSPGHDSMDQPAAGSILKAQSAGPAINKPRRTRLRTVPVLAHPTIAKGQSSPATLKSMLPGRQLSEPSPVLELPEVIAVEEETMYEIPSPLTTPVRVQRSTNSGSVTPRQKALFSSLLGETSSSTPMPSISALQLTDRKPRSLLGALSRSKSDLTYSAQSRKTRLIDTLKHIDTSSEEEDSASDSEEEPKELGIHIGVVKNASEEPQKFDHAADTSSDDMDVDVEVVADSQTSQATGGFGARSRLTYAKARSYLQETNPEDALLISMDLDDDLGFDSQNKEGLSEDDEDPTSQVRARHELKRQGQQTWFNDEAEMLINDISAKSSKSIRRGAMLELCTKMADPTFANQLLDSSLAHHLFKHITSNGEVIFDFATTVMIVFILGTHPTYTVLDQVYRAGIVATLVRLASNDEDITRIAKDRKTNLSKIAQESVGMFRKLVQESSIWSAAKPEKVSPQLIALKALESLIFGLRSTGNTESLLDQETISQLVYIASKPCERWKSKLAYKEDAQVLDMIFSILEAASVANQKPLIWSTQVLQRLAEMIPIFLAPDVSASTMLAVKLCMNLTNNKPKACQPFSSRAFVQPLISSITLKFRLLHTGLKQGQQIEVLESLILSLGAMINLAELSDQARLNVDDGEQTITTLVEIFLEGSERAAKVC